MTGKKFSLIGSPIGILLVVKSYLKVLSLFFGDTHGVLVRSVFMTQLSFNQNYNLQGMNEQSDQFCFFVICCLV